jgi:hypothetical protein
VEYQVNDAILKSDYLAERASVFLIFVISKTISVVRLIINLCHVTVNNNGNLKMR